MNEVRFSKKWFNPLFFILDDIIKDTSIRTVLIYGGKSSAKTFSVSQILSKECYIKNASSIAFRKESTTIPTTIKQSFVQAIQSMYLTPALIRQDRRFACINGKEIVLKGLDSDEKAKGVEGYKYLLIDELNHFEEAEYRQFQLSLRGIEGQKIFATWNPVDENSWVKVNLVDTYTWEDQDKWKLPCEDSFVKISSCGKVVLIKTTYPDNYFIAGHPEGLYGYRDENLIYEYNKMKRINYNSYRVNVLGEWGKTTYGGEFLKCWRSEKHVAKLEYDPNLAIYLCFDENVNPYFPCGIFQLSKDEKELRLIDSISAKNPNNTVTWMCREITRKLRGWGHKEAVYICGDATSKKDDVKIEKGHNLFQLLRDGLSEFNAQLRVNRSNPSVRMSADFTNLILESNYLGLNIIADDKNRTPILDFENTKEDKNGQVDKTTVQDPLTKVRYQPYGHYCDILRYIVVYAFSNEYTKFQSKSNVAQLSYGRGEQKERF